jgi:hypothetical protein
VKKDPQIAAIVREILDLIKKTSPGKSVELPIPHMVQFNAWWEVTTNEALHQIPWR